MNASTSLLPKLPTDAVKKYEQKVLGGASLTKLGDELEMLNANKDSFKRVLRLLRIGTYLIIVGMAAFLAALVGVHATVDRMGDHFLVAFFISIATWLLFSGYTLVRADSKRKQDLKRIGEIEAIFEALNKAAAPLNRGDDPSDSVYDPLVQHGMVIQLAVGALDAKDAFELVRHNPKKGVIEVIVSGQTVLDRDKQFAETWTAVGLFETIGALYYNKENVFDIARNAIAARPPVR